MKQLRYIDLFAGVGGFRYGIAYKGECVYSNEWDKYANSVYKKHYGECDDRDIRTVKADEIPDHDLLCGGFPCQTFSVAGKRAGFNDTVGTLFFEIARILRDKRPRYLFLENVKGLLSHDSGKTFQTILGVLSDLGYDVQWQVLNSKNFGVPQNRERVFIIGHLRGTPRPQVFPLTQTDGTTDQGLKPGDTKSEITQTVRSRYGNGTGSHIVQLNQPTHSNDRIYGESGIAPTLNTMQGGRRQPFVAIPVLTPDRLEKRQNGRRFKEDGEPSFTLTGQDKHGVYDGAKIRRLTPTECERLQGFPDGWTKYGHDGKEISDTQRYKMMGNAVTTNVIKAIMERLNEN
jgi:DNA (cytosine-5)-methyltransferase 1